MEAANKKLEQVQNLKESTEWSMVVKRNSRRLGNAQLGNAQLGQHNRERRADTPRKLRPRTATENRHPLLNARESRYQE